MFRKRSVLLVGPALLTGACFAGQGIAPPPSETIWPRWQARLSVHAAPLPQVSLVAPAESGAALQGGSLLGDYYFDSPGLRLPGSTGGLRATSGVMVGTRALPPAAGWLSGHRFSASLTSLPGGLAAEGNEAVASLPYLGIGYTGLFAKSGFSFSADLGLVAERGSLGVGRALAGEGGLDARLREIRLTPVLQLGVRYSF